MTQTRTWSPREGAAEFVVEATSHVGHVREVNEDAWLVAPPVFVVADGMGGHAAGDVASGIVVEEFAALEGREDLDPAAIDAVLDRCRTRIDILAADGAAPGTTVVAAVLVQQSGFDYWLVVNVGDSRAYLWSDHALDQVSTDHSVVQELIDAGSITAREARRHPERHLVTRALGGHDVSPADYALVPAHTGATLVLCSDGLSGEITDSHIARILERRVSDAAAEPVADRLVAAALDAGGRDNVTVIVIRPALASAPEVTVPPADLDETTNPSTRRRS